MSLQLECQYLQRTFPIVGTMMGPIEEALIDKLFPVLFRGKEIDANFQKILCHSAKHGGLGIPDPRLSAEIAYNTSKATSGGLVYPLLGCTSLKYVGYRACIRGASAGARKEQNQVEMAGLARQKELAGGQERNHLHKATRNGAWLSTVPHCLNGMEMSQEGFRFNL